MYSLGCTDVRTCDFQILLHLPGWSFQLFQTCWEYFLWMNVSFLLFVALKWSDMGFKLTSSATVKLNLWNGIVDYGFQVTIMCTVGRLSCPTMKTCIKCTPILCDIFYIYVRTWTKLRSIRSHFEGNFRSSSNFCVSVESSGCMHCPPTCNI